MALWNKILLVIWVIGGTGAWAQHNKAPTKASRLGSITGYVVDNRGLARAGIPVTITRQDGTFIQRIYTGRNGHFGPHPLQAGLYAVQVSLPSFLPFSKTAVSIKPGADVLVEVNLRKLAESMKVGLPDDAAKARDDWKWALRSAASERPILRFQEPIEQTPKSKEARSHDWPLRGTVWVSAGNEIRGFGEDPGLRTTFNMLYGSTGSNALDLSGSAGWQSGTPAASMQATWRHRSEQGSKSAFSLTVRQLFLPTAYRQSAAASDLPFGRRIQSVSSSYRNEYAFNDHLDLRYGAFFDTISLGRRMSQWSPFGELAYRTNSSTLWTVGYTSESPRFLLASSGPSATEQQLAIPQVSSEPDSSAVGMRAAIETGKHVEVRWERTLKGRYRVEAATFYDAISNVALSMASTTTNRLVTGLLKDPFSDTYFLNGGNYSSPGARVSLETRLPRGSELVVGYSYSGGLQAVSSDLEADGSGSLRELLRAQREHSVTVKFCSTVPWTRTQFITSYRWLPQNTVIASDPYDKGPARSDPYLNLVVVQPIPSPEILQGRFQAIADFSNLLAQGYLQLRSPDGVQSSYFYPSARSFRGGFSFIF